MGLARQMAKSLQARVLDALGLYVKRRKYIHFGVDWRLDLRFMQGDKALELVVDVGANIGDTVIELRETFADARIMSLEPVPSTYRRLAERVGGMAGVRTFNLALGDVAGTLPMIATPLSEQNSLMGDIEQARAAGAEVVDVQVDTLDAFCQAQGIAHVGLLKIDTEGFEMNVLRGARRMLAAGAVDFIFIECEFRQRPGEPHGNFIDLLRHLEPLGFNVVAFYPDGVDQLGWRWGNVLLCRAQDSTPAFLAFSPFAQRSARIATP